MTERVKTWILAVTCICVLVASGVTVYNQRLDLIFPACPSCGERMDLVMHFETKRATCQFPCGRYTRRAYCMISHCSNGHEMYLVQFPSPGSN